MRERVIIEDLPEWLADPALQPLWLAAARRLSQTGLRPEGVVTVRGLDHSGRRAVGAVLGQAVVRGTVRVDLAALDADLRDRAGVSLAGVVERFTGPVPDLPAERATRQEARSAPIRAAQRWLQEQPDVGARPWVAGWLDGIRRDGLVLSMGLGERDLVDAFRVLASLDPPDVLRSRVQLAADTMLDAHALDDGRPITRLVLRGLALAVGEAVPADAAGRRELWERFGVLPDLVSTTCLALGIGPQAVAEPDRWRLAARAGAPIHITGHDLRAHPGVWAGIREQGVLVCENPRVLEAIAAQCGSRVPVVCTSGQPGVVALEVLRRLCSGGATLRYHGDFDAGGIAIANRLVAIAGVVPWRMSAADYLAAQHPGLPVLSAGPPAAAWDAELAPAMAAAGRVVHEEVVLATLLSDLPPASVP